MAISIASEASWGPSAVATSGQSMPLQSGKGKTARAKLPEAGTSTSAGRVAATSATTTTAGSKVGSRYPKLKASTNEAFCPSLRGQVASELHPAAAVAYELVVDGLDLESVRQSMRLGIEAAAIAGIVRIGAGNYGGKLGPFLIHLKDLVGEGR